MAPRGQPLTSAFNDTFRMTDQPSAPAQMTEDFCRLSGKPMRGANAQAPADLQEIFEREAR